MTGVYRNRNRSDEATASGTVTVGTTATELKVGVSRLDGRDVVTIQPDGKIWYSFDPAVTSSTGILLFKNQIRDIGISGDQAVYAVTDSGTVVVKVQEVA